MSASKPLVVFVPGAFHTPENYALLASHLQNLGHEVLIPPLATNGPATLEPALTHHDDVRAIHDALLPRLDAGDAVILASHSYGSLPATEAVAGLTRAEREARGLPGGVVAVVNVAGFAFPVRGKNIMGGDDPSPVMDYHVLKDGLLSLRPEAKELFYSGCDPSQADEAFGKLSTHQTHKSMNTWPGYIASDITTVPKTWVLTEHDLCIPTAFQEAMAATGKYDAIVRVPTGHAPFLQVPGAVAEAISRSPSVKQGGTE